MGLTDDHDAESAADYCRQLESYVCRKNDGHLIRIVGPAFEQVCGWASRGIPLKVALRGIDRYFERYYAKGTRRRPVRVEFCEADVLDAFDEWRRSVGVTAVRERGDDEESDEPESPGRRISLPSHLERTIARLTAIRPGSASALDAELDRVIRELDRVRASAKGLRGEARERLLQHLRTLDAALAAAARESLDAATLADLRREADSQLAGFRDRMPSDAYERSRGAAVDRLVRDRMRLPTIAIE